MIYDFSRCHHMPAGRLSSGQFLNYLAVDHFMFAFLSAEWGEQLAKGVTTFKFRKFPTCLILS